MKKTITIMMYSVCIAMFSVLIATAQAEVCFLPDGKGCDQVPYKEYACKGDDCRGRCNNSEGYYTEAEISDMNLPNSFCQWVEANNGCWQMKCYEIPFIEECDTGYYNLAGAKDSEGWNCEGCSDSEGTHYRCEKKQCQEGSSISCTTGGNECKKCANVGYSGDNVCQELQDVAASCPEGFDFEKPTAGCWNEKAATCGNGKMCYKAFENKCEGEHKVATGTGAACGCGCEKGYTLSNGECVEDEDKWFVMQFEDNLSSCFTFDNFEGDGVSVLDGGYLKFFIGKSFKINYIHDDEEDLYDRATAKIIANNYDFGTQSEFTIDDDFLHKVFPDGVENYQWYMNEKEKSEAPSFLISDIGCEPISVADYYVTVNLVSYIDEPDSPDGVCRKTFIGYNYATGDLDFLKNAEYILEFSDIKYRGGDQASGMCDSGVSLNGDRLDCSKADYDCDNTYENPYPIITSAQLGVLKFNEEKQIHEVVQTISAMNGWEKCQTVTINSKKVEICLNIDSTDR